LDTDGDGLTNRQEFEAGTNPIDPTSRLGVIGMTRSDNNVTLTFALAVVGKNYQLESRNGLDDVLDAWDPVSGAEIFTPAITGSMVISDPEASLTKQFYRIRLLP